MPHWPIRQHLDINRLSYLHFEFTLSLSFQGPLPPPHSTMEETLPSPTSHPSIFAYTLSFLLVGAAWGLTTPFIRRAAISFHPPTRSWVKSARNSWIKRKVLGGLFTVYDLLRSPAYAAPLVLNLTGSVWFFLLVGKAGKFPLLPMGEVVEGVGKVSWNE